MSSHLEFATCFPVPDTLAAIRWLAEVLPPADFKVVPDPNYQDENMAVFSLAYRLPAVDEHHFGCIRSVPYKLFKGKALPPEHAYFGVTCDTIDVFQTERQRYSDLGCVSKDHGWNDKRQFVLFQAPGDIGLAIHLSWRVQPVIVV